MRLTLRFVFASVASVGTPYNLVRGSYGFQDRSCQSLGLPKRRCDWYAGVSIAVPSTCYLSESLPAYIQALPPIMVVLNQRIREVNENHPRNTKLYRLS